ncbi:MAG TPA: hypothetical protein VGF56_10290 [Rhizomicrobium sp.]
MAMEEPLLHATQFCQAIQIAHNEGDEEMEALAFVASEAFIRLEFVQAQLRAIFAALSGNDAPEEEAEAAFQRFDPTNSVTARDCGPPR